MAGGRSADLTPTQLREVWVLAGGRCCICNKFLLNGDLLQTSTNIGQGAHVLPSGTSERAPRAKAKPIPGLDPSTPENVMLVCFEHHQQIDAEDQIFTAQLLLEIKARHQAKIFELTGVTAQERTSVVRIRGTVKGYSTPMSSADAALAVLKRGERRPVFPPSASGDLFLLDVTEYPQEQPPSAAYYDAVRARLEELVEQTLKPMLKNQEIGHISLFAFLPIPVLVLLGTLLDDTGNVDIFQRHRSTESWEWPRGEASSTFSSELVDADKNASEVTLVLALTGNPDLSGISGEVPSLPVAIINGAPGSGLDPRDMIASPADLQAFNAEVGSLLREIESAMPAAQTLHVVAAAPISAAIALGRAFNPDKFPQVVLYHFSGTTYEKAIVIDA